jgi:phosphoribosylaminoimidazole-succinocarboxamide synthase
MANSNNETVLQLELPGVKKLKSGKVRELFSLGQLEFGFTNELERKTWDLELFELGEGDKILIGATDRISAFDVIMPTGIPNKGRVLVTLSEFWFRKTAHIIPNHLLTSDFARFPTALKPYRSLLEGRSMIVRKCEPLPVECVVRGYLAGSGWKEYIQSQSVCGIKLPAGLVESSELPEPIFTPATKEQSGHDINISFEQAASILGKPLAVRVRDASLAIYKWAREFARERGIIIADTKFEFGTLPNGDLILIDEVLTPDSSRFWPAEDYKPGRSQASFDKQFVRDYLETLDWNKTPPGPMLPPEVVARTSAKYLEAYEKLTGKKL